MKNSVIKKILILGLGIAIIYVIFRFFLTFNTISPFMDNVFVQNDKITTQQSLTDSLFEINLENKTPIQLNLKDGQYVFKFIDITQKLLNTTAIELNGIKLDSNQGKYFIISTNDIETLLKFKKTKEINFPIYQVDTSALPFKFRKLLYPYNVMIKDGVLLKTTVGDVNQ